MTPTTRPRRAHPPRCPSRLKRSARKHVALHDHHAGQSLQRIAHARHVRRVHRAWRHRHVHPRRGRNSERLFDQRWRTLGHQRRNLLGRRESRRGHDQRRAKHRRNDRQFLLELRGLLRGDVRDPRLWDWFVLGWRHFVGTECYHDYAATGQCPSGWTSNGSECQRVITSIHTPTACANAGDSWIGGQCIGYTGFTSYTCPSGGTDYGTVCQRDDGAATPISYDYTWVTPVHTGARLPVKRALSQVRRVRGQTLRDPLVTDDTTQPQTRGQRPRRRTRSRSR